MENSIGIGEKYSEFIINRIFNEKSGCEHLKNLIRQAQIHKDLLTVSKCENADFVIYENKILLVTQPHFERLAMIEPPSFEFSMILNVSGYFHVKYASLQNKLPSRIEPFNIRFSGILCERCENPEIFAEAIRVVKNSG
jgi:hypothetical protein